MPSKTFATRKLASHIKRKQRLVAPNMGLVAPNMVLVAPNMGFVAPNMGLVAPNMGFVVPRNMAPAELSFAL